MKSNPPLGSLVTRRTALVLYGVLLVLPTIVLGGLHWRQVEIDQEAQLEAGPRDVDDAARRLTDGLKERLDELVASESQRLCFEYRERYFPPDTMLATLAFVPSPLSKYPRPPGVLGWFQFGTNSPEEPEIQVGDDGDLVVARALEQELAAATRDYVRVQLREDYLQRLQRGTTRFEERSYSVPVVAVNLSTEDDLICLNDERVALRDLDRTTVRTRIYDFQLRLVRDSRNTPRFVATRAVTFEPITQLERMPACFAPARDGPTLVQGFFIDPDWLLHELPRSLCAQVLDGSQEFFPARSNWQPTPAYDAQEIRPILRLGIEASARDIDFGTMWVAVNTERMRERFASQRLHLLGVAAMLVISLGTGLVLLMRSVQGDLESARHTENFVSAVTHELRTPLSAIRLYGEMLQDGWVEDPAKRAEYYRRIVREAQRLETLVEAVLEKGRLTSKETPVELGDLNRAIEPLRAALLGTDEAPANDVVFELGAELPKVWLFSDGVRSIVTNLVENARKYAPVARGGEPIRVVTRRDAGDVVLEVLDRGPGIPMSERDRIFEAFYRVGNETTRTAKGTGLGLHLVALQTEAMGGHVEVDGRSGGGTVFRVHFKTGDPA